MFKTQYDPHTRFHCDPGSREHVTYGGYYDDRGRVCLKETGIVNLYDEIQSHAESVDIHVLMERYQRGDIDALSKRQGFFGDALSFPKTLAEFLNYQNDLHQLFDSLPSEVKEKFDNNFEFFLASSADSDFVEKLGVKQETVTKPAIPVDNPPEVKE